MRNKRIRHVINIIVLLLAGTIVAACSGGISGTGDGGPVIIDPNGDAGSVSAPEGSSGTADSAGNEPNEGTSDSQQPSNVPDISSLPAALNQAANRSDGNSASGELGQNLLTIAFELQQLQTDILSRTELQPAPLTGTNFNNQINIEQGDSQTTIEWSDDGRLKYAFSTSSVRVLYVLQQDQNLTTRRFDKTTNRLFQASLLKTTDTPDQLTIEAILNNNGDEKFFRSLATADSTITFSSHPTDNNMLSQREIVSAEGTVTDLQTCTAANSVSDCSLDTDWTAISENPTANDTFAQAAASIDAALSEISSPVDSLPQEVDTAVLASTDNELAIEVYFQCGLQRYNQDIRPFCTRPLPLEQNSTLFQETLSAGEIFYLQLQ